MKRGDRVVHGDKELIEKLGRNDPCPCGSGRRFQEMLPAIAPVSKSATTTRGRDALRTTGVAAVSTLCHRRARPGDPN
ncbi:MAG: SEC-C domain-containing protein [Rhodospirillaceae bacterium]|nr:SEC-C domain-containing protein [Rhodospirillaceae bacterium]